MDNITERRRHFPDRTRRVPACYDRDLYSWAVEQAALLRAGRIIEADAGNIAEELDDVGTEQYNKLESALRISFSARCPLSWQQLMEREIAWPVEE
jgi:hypothetical protein